MDYNKIIGANIRYERKLRDMTIEELAEVIGMAPGFLGLIERGQRGTTIKNLCKLADFFSLPLDDMVKRSLEGFAEGNRKTPKELKLMTAMSLIENMDEKELDFVVEMMKRLMRLRETDPEDEFDLKY